MMKIQYLKDKRIIIEIERAMWPKYQTLGWIEYVPPGEEQE